MVNEQQRATAARLADDKRCLAFYEDLKGNVLVYPDLAAGLRDWIKEARSSLHTLAAQPAGTGQTGNCPHCYGTGMRNALND